MRVQERGPLPTLTCPRRHFRLHGPGSLSRDRVRGRKGSPGVAVYSSNLADDLQSFPRPLGKYILLGRLAVGGMAELYLALLRRDFGFEKLVALKTVLPSFRDEQAFLHMLLNEARVAATLSHPNIAQIFDIGEADGSYFIAMEYVQGADIRSLFQAVQAQGQARLPLKHCLLIATQALAGLGYAHDKCGLNGEPLGIVHRDISPANIIVSTSGDVKLVDFGIAKSRDQLGERTAAGQLKGKFAYMSPEQALGTRLDRRSDLFSFGVLLYELTTGTRLFKAETRVETLQRVLSGTVTPPSEVCPGYPQELEAIVLKALSREPGARYQRAQHLQYDLEQFARRSQLELSPMALARWVQGLVVENVRQQNEMVQRSHRLAQGFRIAKNSSAELGILEPSAARTEDARGGSALSTPTGVRERSPSSQRSQTPPPQASSSAPVPSSGRRPPPPPASSSAPVSKTPPPVFHSPVPAIVRRKPGALTPLSVPAPPPVARHVNALPASSPPSSRAPSPLSSENASAATAALELGGRSTIPSVRSIPAPAPRLKKRRGRPLLLGGALLLGTWASIDAGLVPVPEPYQAHVSSLRDFRRATTEKAKVFAGQTWSRAANWLDGPPPEADPLVQSVQVPMPQSDGIDVEVEVDRKAARLWLNGRPVTGRVLHDLTSGQKYLLFAEDDRRQHQVWFTAVPNQKLRIELNRRRAMHNTNSGNAENPSAEKPSLVPGLISATTFNDAGFAEAFQSAAVRSANGDKVDEGSSGDEPAAPIASAESSESAAFKGTSPEPERSGAAASETTSSNSESPAPSDGDSPKRSATVQAADAPHKASVVEVAQ